MCVSVESDIQEELKKKKKRKSKMAENGVESTGDVTLDNAVKQWLEFDKVSRVVFYILI